MKDTNSFTCKHLNRTLTFSRCIRNQREAEEYFGTQPPKKGSCHLCTTGRGVRDWQAVQASKKIVAAELQDFAATSREVLINGFCASIKPEKGENMQGERKPCRNCERVMTMQQDNLCGGCNESVRRARVKKGTPEYDQVLAQAKERFAGKASNYPKTIKKEAKPPERETIRPEGETMKAVKIGGNGEEKVIPITLLINVEVNVKAIRVG